MYIFQVKITPSVAKHLIQMYNFLKPRLTANAGPNDMYYIGEWVIFYYFIMKIFWFQRALNSRRPILRASLDTIGFLLTLLLLHLTKFCGPIEK